MAKYTTTTDIVLTVNGSQAKKMFKQLEDDAKRLGNEIDKAAKAGDKNKVKKLQRELTRTNKMMDQLKGATNDVSLVLSRLDKATPKELNKTLKQLQRELNGIERGSAAWNEHVEKIRRVKAELNRLNDTMKTQESKWSRMNRWLNDSQTFIMGVTAAVTGLVMAGRKAVNAYAEMEQEEANVRKFTGMTADEVRALNEEFKKIDTRSSREELNRLAQEAGRLGKQSQEDVLGFVRAADQINVALDDLGDGATLTISKLTGIFGDEKRLGTEKAMLSVGSVINELSQNCSASAPYIAEFASRLGGVGSQANMTIPQIMAFAAVLDSNNQKLEASATALSQVIVRIYQEPEKYARVAGMDAVRFAELVKKDMNGALVEFLQTLGAAGKMDVLSPMFKDMGENGSRAISALSTLAGHIGEVVQQQITANEAFREATSVTTEFEVQNNTVQAGLEKAKKRLNEIAVSLGEKLLPVMSKVISGTSLLLRFMETAIGFIIKNRVEILTVTAAITVYAVAVNLAAIRMTAASVATKLWGVAMGVVKGVLPAVRLLIVPLINTVQYFTNGLQVNYAMQQRWRNSLAAMKLSSWSGLVLTAAAAVALLAKKLYDNSKEAEKARREHEEYIKKIRDVDSAAAEYSAKEISRLDTLYRAATNEKGAREERFKAAQKLQELYPEYFGNMTTEEIMLGRSIDKYNELRHSILEVARAKAAAAKIEENQKEILTLEQQRDDLEKDRQRKQAEYNVKNWNSMKAGKNAGSINPYATNVTASAQEAVARKALEDAEAAVREVDNKIALLNEANDFLQESYKDSLEKMGDSTPDSPEQSDVGGQNADSPGKSGDRFKEEKDWRERQQALARIAYATGESDYISHTERMNDIEIEYYEKILARTDLAETERLSITAKHAEALRKWSEDEHKSSLKEVNDHYDEQSSDLKQFYLDGLISKQSYDRKSEELEMMHQKAIIDMTEEGSSERIAAEKRLADLILAQKTKQLKEKEELEKKLSSVKSEYFGDNPEEKQAKFDADLEILDVVLERELEAAGDNEEEKLRIYEAYEIAKLALMKKYGLLQEAEQMNSMQQAVAKSVEWLNSDAGKAFTGAMSAAVSAMSSVFSQLTSSVQADLEVQTAAVNKRYDAEIARAEGNSYKVRKLEKEKEKELAKLKNEANKKMFAMQVIQAVAQTAQNAISAYGSAASIPLVGYIIAPIAAAAAVAAGMMQVAAIKKQQQASDAQGYAEGGFTPKGERLKPVGVVHAGEWVASQKLVNDRRTRPLIDALDYAQRTNTIGSITGNDVSKSVVAQVTAASYAYPPNMERQQPNVVIQQNGEYADAMRRLSERLDEPFVTVNTVSGDFGIQKALDNYSRLLRNKSPKSKK